jgi:hypothetical protein
MTHLDHPILNQAVRYILDGPHLSVLATMCALTELRDLRSLIPAFCDQ